MSLLENTVLQVFFKHHVPIIKSPYMMEKTWQWAGLGVSLASLWLIMDGDGPLKCKHGTNGLTFYAVMATMWADFNWMRVN